jgi:hypothetical protein
MSFALVCRHLSSQGIASVLLSSHQSTLPALAQCPYSSSHIHGSGHTSHRQTFQTRTRHHCCRPCSPCHHWCRRFPHHCQWGRCKRVLIVLVLLPWLEVEEWAVRPRYLLCIPRYASAKLSAPKICDRGTAPILTHWVGTANLTLGQTFADPISNRDLMLPSYNNGTHSSKTTTSQLSTWMCSL